MDDLEFARLRAEVADPRTGYRAGVDAASQAVAEALDNLRYSNPRKGPIRD
ncbi:hypothetical protein ACFOY2_45720 [Nonomuraea purpurea]|uniref:Uncharacterized protein n=1 Tax=Nonomuraea purpurea TaxID=1849276 RepID=A0ABV8GNV6_9ACTN